MEKITDEAYEFNEVTRFHIRTFVDPLHRIKPVFVIEVGVGSEKSLDMNRVEIAKELAEEHHRSPDEITWLELSQDGSLRKIEFEYTHTDNINRDFHGMTPDEMREATRKGHPASYGITRYNTKESDVSRQDFQVQTGDPLETYEVRQNEELKQVNLPPVFIHVDEMRDLISKHGFENVPDISL